MREVDEALARAFARTRAAATGHPAIPPAHHLAAAPAADPARASVRWPDLVLRLERDYADRFARLADVSLDAASRRGMTVLWFTGCHRAEGRTTLVLALTRALAHRPGRTLLVDLDLDGPAIGRLLGLRTEAGLEEVAAGTHALSDALVNAPDDHLSVLPLRSAVPGPRDFLTGPGWSCLAARLRREFELVLLDGGPIAPGLGPAVVPRGIDAAVLVLNPATTGAADLSRARQALAAAGVPLLGLAETFVV
jgi:Mrp family chromosome partitioning ATPase